MRKETFAPLGLGNFTEFRESCDALRKLINETFERIGFDFIDNNKALEQVQSGLWFYIPLLDNTSRIQLITILTQLIMLL